MKETIQNKNDSIPAEVRSVINVYTRATGSKVCVYDQNYLPVQDGENECAIERDICRHCTGACREMHTGAIQEASRSGGSHIYSCRLGLAFWCSPIYHDGRFSGALRGGGFLRMDADAAVFGTGCRDDFSPEEFSRRILEFPKADDEKSKSLAEMLLLCAESLSSGSEDYHEILRRRSTQQKLLTEKIEALKKQYPEGSILPGYPLEKERQLILALRKGDKKNAADILGDLLATLVFSNQNHFRYVQLRAIELAVLFSRAGVNPGGGGTALESSNNSLKRIQEAKNIEELTDVLYSAVEKIAGRIASFQGIPHAAALRKAERYIQENFTRKVSLKEVAAISGLSAPYFSTIFKEEMGENLSKYLNRLRVERASRLLLESDMGLSEIAAACCFEDQSWFSKIFKAYTGISPGKYRNQGGGMVREISENNFSGDCRKTIKGGE